MIDPEFVLGGIEGVFVGIYDWFKDIVVMIGDLLQFIGNTIQSAWKTVKETWETATTGKVPQWVMDLIGPAQTAGQWLRDNKQMVVKFIVHLIKDPKARQELGVSIKDAIVGAVKSMARNAGAWVAKQQSSFMDAPAYEQGKTVGTVAGYLIPEVLLAVFSGTIGTWIKGGLKAFQTARATVKALEGIKWLVQIGKDLFKALEKFGGIIKKLASGVFKKLGEAFDAVLKFFKGLLGLERAAKAEKALTRGEEMAKKLGWPKAEDGYIWVAAEDGKTPIYRAKSGTGNKTRKYDPEKKAFYDVKPKQPKYNKIINVEQKADELIDTNKMKASYQRYFDGKKAIKEEPLDEDSWVKNYYKNQKRGIIAEHIGDADMAKKGYEKLNGSLTKLTDSPKGAGIDGLWKKTGPPTEYVVTDAKYGKSGLGSTKYGDQLSNEWINHHLKSLGLPDEELVAIKKAMRDKKLKRIVQQVDNEGSILERLVNESGKFIE